MALRKSITIKPLFKPSFQYSFGHSFIPSFLHSLTHSFTHSLIHSIMSFHLISFHFIHFIPCHLISIPFFFPTHQQFLSNKQFLQSCPIFETSAPARAEHYLVDIYHICNVSIRSPSFERMTCYFHLFSISVKLTNLQHLPYGCQYLQHL